MTYLEALRAMETGRLVRRQGWPPLQTLRRSLRRRVRTDEFGQPLRDPGGNAIWEWAPCLEERLMGRVVWSGWEPLLEDMQGEDWLVAAEICDRPSKRERVKHAV